MECFIVKSVLLLKFDAIKSKSMLLRCMICRVCFFFHFWHMCVFSLAFSWPVLQLMPSKIDHMQVRQLGQQIDMQTDSWVKRQRRWGEGEGEVEVEEYLSDG